MRVVDKGFGVFSGPYELLQGSGLSNTRLLKGCCKGLIYGIVRSFIGA